MSTSENQKGTKNPITLKIKFKSGSIEQFIERYSVDVSRGGIFIRTKEPLAVGTPLRFEFQLQDGTPLIGGDGTVVWNRTADASRPSVVPGMGVRFDKLTPDSQRVLERILSDKEKLPNTQMESRFDAGVRASMANTPEPTASEETPKGSMFGDEPTRAMAADQVNKLAEAMQRGSTEEDQPTRNVASSDLSDEIRKLTGASSEGSGNLPAIPTAGLSAAAKMEPMRSPVGSPMMRSTLLGQGFGLAPALSSPVSISPSAGLPRPLSIEPSRKEPSGSVPAANIEVAANSLESAITPVKSAEVAARVADSQRTPANSPESALPAISGPQLAALSISAPASHFGKVEIPEPTPYQSHSGHVSLPPKLEAEPLDQARPLLPVGTPAPSGGSSKGLFMGVGLLVVLVAAVGYFTLVAPKLNQPENKNPPTETVPPQPLAPPPAPPPVVLIPEKPASLQGPDFKGEKPSKAGNSATGDGPELISEPAGAQVELAGKAIGTTPLKLPSLAPGKFYDLKVTLRGYQETRQKIKAGDDAKNIQIKLLPIERQVEILSTPKGSDVYLDGKKIGRTPWIIRKVDLSKAISVEIRHSGFETWTHNLSDAEAFVLRNKKEVLTLNATLEPASSKSGSRSGKKGHDSSTPGSGQDASKPGSEPSKPATEPAEPTKAAADSAKPAAEPEGTENAKPAAP